MSRLFPMHDPRDLETLRAQSPEYPQAGAGGCFGFQLEFHFPEDVPLLQEHMRRGWTVVWPPVHMQALLAINDKLDILVGEVARLNGSRPPPLPHDREDPYFQAKLGERNAG